MEHLRVRVRRWRGWRRVGLKKEEEEEREKHERVLQALILHSSVVTHSSFFLVDRAKIFVWVERREREELKFYLGNLHFF